MGDLTVAKKYVLLLGQMISQIHSHSVMVHLLQYVNLVPTRLTSHLTGIAALQHLYIIYYINVLVDSTCDTE